MFWLDGFFVLVLLFLVRCLSMRLDFLIWLLALMAPEELKHVEQSCEVCLVRLPHLSEEEKSYWEELLQKDRIQTDDFFLGGASNDLFWCFLGASNDLFWCLLLGLCF